MSGDAEDEANTGRLEVRQMGMISVEKAKLAHQVVVRGWINTPSNEVPGENQSAVVEFDTATGCLYVAFETKEKDKKTVTIVFPPSSVLYAFLKE